MKKRGAPKILEWWQLYWVGKFIEEKLGEFAVENAVKRHGNKTVRDWQKYACKQHHIAVKENKEARLANDRRAIVSTWEKAREVRKEAAREIDRAVGTHPQIIKVRRQRGREPEAIEEGRKWCSQAYNIEIKFRRAKEALVLYREKSKEPEADIRAALAELAAYKTASTAQK